ncbi:MAG TPA: DUF202 domain-containing protein [Acidobacteriaceae bacterium]|nr:DUF202 domain-containing protein [Acidobacteriaceae bacterium]
MRTGLGLMAVGFALARFGLFLREFQSQQHAPPHSTGLSVDSGVGLVVLGVAVNISAVIGHLRTVKELRTGAWMPGRVARTAVCLALLLALFGIAVAVWLLLLRS